MKAAKADGAEFFGAAARWTGTFSQFFEVRPFVQGQTTGQSKPVARCWQSRLCARFYHSSPNQTKLAEINGEVFLVAASPVPLNIKIWRSPVIDLPL
jgi:hypothetical protein